MVQAVKVMDIPPERIKKFERRLRGEHGFTKFLGQTEGLIEVVRYDLETLGRIGLKPRDIAVRMAELVRKAKKYSETEVEPGIIVGIEQYRGSEECPFLINQDFFEISPDSMCPGYGGSQDWKITNRELDITILTGDLVLHLVSEHHFFEGQINRYRLDPLLAAHVMNLIDRETYESHKCRERLHDSDVDSGALPELIRSLDAISQFETRKDDPDEREYYELLKQIRRVIMSIRCEKALEMVPDLISEIGNCELSDRIRGSRMFLLWYIFKAYPHDIKGSLDEAARVISGLSNSDDENLEFEAKRFLYRIEVFMKHGVPPE